MALTIWLLTRIVILKTEIWTEALLMVVCMLAVYTILNLSLPAVRMLASYQLGLPAVLALRDVLILFAAAMLGKLVCRIFREPSIVPPVAIFTAALDVFIVRYWLPVYMKHAPDLLPQVGVSVPIVGSAIKTGHVALMGLIGPADFMFFSAFIGCCIRFNLSPSLTASWTAVVLTAFILIQFTLTPIFPIIAQLPGLVPIAVTFLVVNHRQFKLSHSEWRSIGIAALIVVILMGILATFVLK